MQCSAGAAKGGLTKPDWAHVFFTVLDPLPMPQLQPGGPQSQQDGHQPLREGEIASALRTATAALMAKHSSRLGRAGVVQWEVRLRMPGGLPAWRVVVASPTGAWQLPPSRKGSSRHIKAVFKIGGFHLV